MMWYPIHSINLNLLTVKGRSDLFFRLEVIKKIIGIVILCVTIPHGIIWMVSGGIVSSLFALIVNTYYTGKLINVGFIKQMKDLLPILGISLLMWFIVLISLLITPNSYMQLVIGICTGILFYIVCARMLLKAEWSEVLSMIPSKFKKK